MSLLDVLSTTLLCQYEPSSLNADTKGSSFKRSVIHYTYNILLRKSTLKTKTL